jgi:selenocysteine-specific elongation factor
MGERSRAGVNSSATARDGSRGLVLGTAGHIDHGKTALIRALTGTDTDRLPEEKSRGITIDLGFAALDLPDTGRLSVVDVPGHEGLVRTMVAGATGIDLLLLVVAADEGVMPQTREHIAICDLLGLECGVVALTKTDLADEELIELSGEEVSELLETTGLAGTPIVPVSAQTGEGLEALREAIARAARDARPRTPRNGPPRLGVDRVFAMRGFGTVATGTLVGGALKKGEAIEVHPSGLSSRIRGLQSHGQEVDRVAPGTRCAVNLQGLEVAQLHRGDVLTRTGSLASSLSADVELHWLEGARSDDEITAVELLVGTAERRARLASIGDSDAPPDGRTFARLHIDGAPLTLLPGDRFIVRGFAKTSGYGATLGGGVVLDCAPPRRRRSDPALRAELEILAGGDVGEGLRARVMRAGYAGRDGGELGREMGLSGEAVEKRLLDVAGGHELLRAGGSLWIAEARIGDLEKILVGALEAFHAAEPMRPGMPRGALRGRLPENVPREIAELALDRLRAAERIVSEADLVRLVTHRVELDTETRALADRIRAEAEASDLEPPNGRDWTERLGISLERFRDLVAYLEREGELIRAPGDLWFAASAIETLQEKVLRHFESEEELDTQTYKTLIGTSRRTAMPLMELFDELHVTRRRGEIRIARAGGRREAGSEASGGGGLEEVE